VTTTAAGQRRNGGAQAPARTIPASRGGPGSGRRRGEVPRCRGAQSRRERKQRAAGQLRADASAALQAGNYPEAVERCKAPRHLLPSPDLSRELSQARAKLDEAARARAAAEAAARSSATPGS